MIGLFRTRYDKPTKMTYNWFSTILGIEDYSKSLVVKDDFLHRDLLEWLMRGNLAIISTHGTRRGIRDSKRRLLRLSSPNPIYTIACWSYYAVDRGLCYSRPFVFLYDDNAKSWKKDKLQRPFAKVAVVPAMTYIRTRSAIEAYNEAKRVYSKEIKKARDDEVLKWLLFDYTSLRLKT
ncbi:MAG: hypothetical protein DRN49_01815 [Thaumarchaeota archaeon]|nr:MAG: hypothetical protein DRN49_01815 [Nitrososphaerota archaeon]